MWARDMWGDIESMCHGCLHFVGKKLYFDDNKDDLLNDSGDVFIVDTKGSLQRKQLSDITS